MKRICPLLLFLFPFAANASHIVGGELNFKWLSGDVYAIRMTVFRDCFSNGPDFDPAASLGIFDVNNVFLESRLMAYSQRDTLTSPIHNPCFVFPRNSCYERATYFDTLVLPSRVGGYQLVYQRCCRNTSNLNIVDPGNTGVTFYAHVPDRALAAIDSNPLFTNWPPPFLCAHVPFVFDHSAIDADGDSLVYELFQPLDGPFSYAVAMPQPPNAPPYTSVIWQPPFNTANMLGGLPLTIDPASGKLSALPSSIGHFVVGIKVIEYRNGVYLGETRRDYQFNVVPCPTLVIAAQQAPQVICGSTTVSFQNYSNGARKYFWDFGDKNTAADTSHLVIPSYTYPDTGTYITTLIAYGSNGRCNDTNRYAVRIQPAYHSSFNYTTASCDPQQLSFSGLCNNTSTVSPVWHWNFGDNMGSILQSPAHTYPSGGNYQVSLLSSLPNSLNCSDTVSARLLAIPASSSLFIPNTFSPNADGNNDVFRVRGPSYEYFYFAVYNRIGQMVFETHDQNEGWDGTVNGIRQEPAVFAYYVRAGCGNNPAVTKKGNVTLIR